MYFDRNATMSGTKCQFSRWGGVQTGCIARRAPTGRTGPRDFVHRLLAHLRAGGRRTCRLPDRIHPRNPCVLGDELRAHPGSHPGGHRGPGVGNPGRTLLPAHRHRARSRHGRDRARLGGGTQSALFSGIAAISLGNMLWVYATAQVGPTLTGVYSNVLPIPSVLISWLRLGEPLEAAKIGGAVLIIAGIAFLRIHRAWGSKVPGRAAA